MQFLVECVSQPQSQWCVQGNRVLFWSEVSKKNQATRYKEVAMVWLHQQQP
jgi:hypothetical protein